MKKYLLVLMAALFPQFAAAQNCSTPPTCASLGFIYTAAQCGSIGTKCPFDTAQYFCEHPNRNATVGNYFFNDGTVSTSSYVSGKTLVGVVIKAPSSTNHGVVIYKTQTKNYYINADNRCREMTSRGIIGRWRLPTDSELSTLIGNSTLRSRLSTAGASLTSEYYWSCTNRDWSRIWVRRGSDNNQEHDTKSSNAQRYILCAGEF